MLLLDFGIHSAGIFGFENDENNASKWHCDLKKKCSDEEIDQMKNEFMRLIAYHGSSALHDNVPAISQPQTQMMREPISNLIDQAKAGDAESMVRLGECYVEGIIVVKNEKEAYRWFESASKDSNEVGTVRKADCLMAGFGVEQNFGEGFEVLHDAAYENKSGK